MAAPNPEKDLIINVRSVVVANGSVTFPDLLRDYLELCGPRSSFQALGYRTLQDFVASHPEEFIVNGNTVRAVEKESSAHIQKLVNEQKPKKKRQRFVPTPRRLNHVSRPAYNRDPRHVPLAFKTTRGEVSDLRSFLNRARAGPPPSVQRTVSLQTPSKPPLRVEVQVNKENDRTVFNRASLQRENPPTRATFTSRPTANASAPLENKPSKKAEPVEIDDDVIVMDYIPGNVKSSANAFEFLDTPPLPSLASYSDIPSSPPKTEASAGVNAASSMRYTMHAQQMQPSSLGTYVKGLQKPQFTPSSSNVILPLSSLNAPKSNALSYNNNCLLPTPTPQNQVFVDCLQKRQLAFNPTSSNVITRPILPLSSANAPKNNGSLPAPTPQNQALTGYFSQLMAEQQQLHNIQKAMQTTSLTAANLPQNHFTSTHVNGVSGIDKTVKKEPSVDIKPCKKSIAERFTRDKPEKVQNVPTTISDKLEEYCRKQGLEMPDSEVLPQRKKDGKSRSPTVTGYVAIVKVGNHLFKSSSSSTRELAEEQAKTKAYEALQETERLNNAFLSNMQKILHEQRTIWLKAVGSYYEEAYGEKPPAQWEALLKSSSLFTVSQVTGGEILALHNPKNVHASSGEPSRQTPSVPPGFKPRTSAPPGFVNSPPTSLGAPPGFNISPDSAVELSWPPLNKELPPLVLPKDFCNVYVQASDDPAKIVVRMVGDEYSGELGDMLTSLELDMADCPAPVEDPAVNELYVAKHGGVFIDRVRLIDVTGDVAVVYCIDEGEERSICTTDLYHLSNKYRELPAQSFYISLLGLEDFLDVSYLRELTSTIAGRSFVFGPFERRDDILGVPWYAGLLWDTQDPVVDTIINCKFLEMAISVLPSPTISVKNMTNMLVSHVSDSVYLHELNKRGPKLIETLFKYKNVDLQRASRVVCDVIYIVEPYQGFKARCKVLGISNTTEKFQVHCIDYGYTIDAGLNELNEADSFSMSLTEAPPQCAKALLASVNAMTDRQLFIAKNLLPSGAPVLVKVVAMEGKVPRVELRRRDDSEGSLTCVNQVIMLSGKEGDEEEDMSEIKLPAEGECETVRVTLAASPGVFYAHFGNYFEQIDDLMNDLQEINFESEYILNEQNLKPSELYAVRYSSNWYRGKLNEMIGSENASVELYDFGNLIIVPSEVLRELPTKYKALPKMAFLAKLHGVCPVNCDWTPSDCVLFKELVSGKSLAGFLRGRRKNILQIQLVDTEGDKDLDIAEEFLRRGIAKKIED